MQLVQLKVNVDRIVQRIEELAKCSVTERGVTRLWFTKESQAANELVCQWMREARPSGR